MRRILILAALALGLPALGRAPLQPAGALQQVAVGLQPVAPSPQSAVPLQPAAPSPQPAAPGFQPVGQTAPVLQPSGQAQPRLIPVRDFLRMGDDDTTRVILRGVVESIRNPESGNLYLKDATGKVLLYRMLDYEGGSRSFRAIGVLVGDTLAVCGCRSLYGSTIEMKNGHLVYYAKGPDHDKIAERQKAEKMPRFKGGTVKDFEKWVASRVQYPAGCSAQGTVVVKFVVGRNGKVQEIQVVDKVHPLLDAEAVRVVASSPKWKPGKYNGQPSRTVLYVPVEFKR